MKRSTQNQYPLAALIQRIALTCSWIFLSFWAFGQAPTIAGFGPNMGPIGTVVTINGTNFNQLNSLTIGGMPAVVVANNGSQLVGMVMTGAVDGKIEIRTNAGLVQSAQNFQVVKPNVPNKLFNPDRLPITLTGPTVAAISADGKTIAIGASFHNDSIGAVQIFISDGIKPFEYFTTITSNYTLDFVGKSLFGNALALSADGNTIAIGGPGDRDRKGAVWILQKSGTGYQFIQKIVANDTIAISKQGSSVALSADGGTVIFGSIGGAFIFNRSSNYWIQQGSKLIGDSTGKFEYSSSVAMSADGNTAAISPYFDDIHIPSTLGTPINLYMLRNSAFVYKKKGAGWFQDGPKIIGMTFPVLPFYFRIWGNISLSADGNTLIIPSNVADESYSSYGAVAFTKNANGWIPKGTNENKILPWPYPVFGWIKDNGYRGITADGSQLLSNTPIPMFNYSNTANHSLFTWEQYLKNTWIDSACVFDGLAGIPYLSANGHSLLIGEGQNYYTVQKRYKITSFIPTSGSLDSIVTIKGKGLTGSYAVMFGSTPAAAFTVIDDSTMTVRLGDGATGYISIATPNGIIESTSLFTYTGMGVSDGAHAGLESKSLGDAIGSRKIYQAMNNQSGILDYSKLIPISSGSNNSNTRNGINLTLSDILPTTIQNTNYIAYNTTPLELITMTNAVDVLSIDFTYQNKTRAVAFATKTWGQSYDHSKNICDRLRNAEILTIENVSIKKYNLVRFTLKNASGQKEYAYSFVIGAGIDRTDYTLQSYWLNKDYSSDNVMYNIQLWAETPTLIDDMATDIITRLSNGMAIRQIASNTGIPTTYISKATRIADTIVVKIYNPRAISNNYLEVSCRDNEYAGNKVTKAILLYNTPYNNTITIPASDLYETTLNLYQNGVIVDQVFLADGNWGLISNKNATVSTFKPTNDLQKLIDNMDDFLLYRNLHVEGTTSDYISTYKLLRAGGVAQNLTGYRTLQFNAAGNVANMNIILVKDGITNWADQYSLNIPITSDATDYTINLDDFTSKASVNKIDPKDISMILFSWTVPGGVSTKVSATINNISFSKTDYVYLNSLNSKEMNIYPNPSKGSFKTTFKSPIATSLHLVVREAATGRIVANKVVKAVIGDNIVDLSIVESQIIGLANYIVSLEGTNSKYISKKIIISSHLY